ncbi:MAG: penicillin-binding protein 2 [Azoarcus sp.]|jgi:cell division protein FtsI (penicillin-binding protein 3)|nr:penicillin-binding protein 2 [Azoarcus sp.]
MSRARKTVTFNHNPLLQLGLPQWRARLVLLVLLAGMVTLLGRSLYLQCYTKEFLQSKGEERSVRELEVPATRGRIADRNGNLLAVSTPVRSIWAIPSVASRIEPGQLRQLAQLLGMNVDDLNARLAIKNKNVALKRQVLPELAGKVAALELPGIYQEDEFRRFYPSGEIMSHLLGFTGVQDHGQEGIELMFESVLAGQAGKKRVVKDLRGKLVENAQIITEPHNGKDVTLAVDSSIQYLAYTALSEAVRRHKAQGGAAVVLDVQTGEVLALVNAPTFNPNNLAHRTGEQLRNRVFTYVFEPGSIMKPFVTAMALESGKFRATTPIDTRNGRFVVGKGVIRDTHPYPTLTVSEIIQKSSNVGVSRMALEFEPESMRDFYARMGFGLPLQTGFPGEKSGYLPPARNWTPFEQATMSFGYGVSVTLIQMARAYLAFARDGELLPLSLTRVDAPPSGTRVFSPQVAREVRQMMETVVAPGGTATRARIMGYRVAGKTGTANKIESRKYVNKYVSSFIGLAPASNPRLVVAVMIDDPTGGQHSGGVVAAPVFAQVAEGSLRALGVAPDVPLATSLHLTATTPKNTARAQASGGM